MMEQPLARPAPQDRAGGYVEDEPRRRPGMLARIARLLVLVAVLAAVAGGAYVYRAELTALIVSFSQSSSSGPPIADRRSLELPPLAGFRAGSGEAVDAALQSTALWKVIKREFPDWYRQRIAEAMQLTQEGKDDAVIGQLIGRKLAELRRQHAASGMAASEEWLKTVATAYLNTVKRLRGRDPEACAGFIRRGEAEPLIVALLQQGSEHTAHLQAQLTTVSRPSPMADRHPACTFGRRRSSRRCSCRSSASAAGRRTIPGCWPATARRRKRCASWCMTSSRPSSPLPTRKHRSAY